MMTNNQLISAKQLGQLLALSKRQVFRLNACGKIPKPVKIAGAIRWSEQTISKWISMGCPDRWEFEVRMDGKGATNAD
ncbi:MAG: helix-turn-helix transcriptional regulator [Planctomycetota bacterium]